MTAPQTLPERLRYLLRGKRHHFTTSAGVQLLAVVGTVEQIEDIERAAQHAEQLDDWLKQTEWVQDESSTGKLPVSYLGMHRADVMRAEIERMRGELVAVLTHDQVRDQVRAIINCGGTVSEQCKIAQPLRLLCRRLGVVL